MKIGILTFHWATNYGAVLQCYALQSVLMDMGHDVQVIDYKPKRYDDSLYQFIRQRKFLHLKRYFRHREWERCIREFRNDKLNLTSRVATCSEISGLASKYNVLISGSDQVMNPYFLMNGDRIGQITPSYFLGFNYDGRRIGYALSFGCVEYPHKECNIASNYIQRFNFISVRERSGVAIVEKMGRNDAVVVPDPTILMSSSCYRSLVEGQNAPCKGREEFVYCFFIRNIEERRNSLRHIIDSRVIWNDNDSDYSISSWLGKIQKSHYVITDSFHCVVMCLKFQKPFVVITDQSGKVGMNDRFYSLLSLLGLDNRILYKDNMHLIHDVATAMINWIEVEQILDEYKNIGVNFLKDALKL